MRIEFDFACKDYCLDRMVPSDLRQLVCERDNAEQRIRELESWIPQAYKEGYQDAQNDESEGFDDDWEASMAKMVFDEKQEPPR